MKKTIRRVFSIIGAFFLISSMTSGLYAGAETFQQSPKPIVVSEPSKPSSPQPFVYAEPSQEVVGGLETNEPLEEYDEGIIINMFLNGMENILFDINKDGEIDFADAFLIKKYIIGYVVI